MTDWNLIFQSKAIVKWLMECNKPENAKLTVLDPAVARLQRVTR